jgi:phenylacetate-CoA ligase
VINAVKQLGKDFDQIIIGAYAPFLKDILDDGTRHGINWKEYNLGFVFSAEAFTEKFRDYIAKVAQPEDPLRFSLNHYGTVDLGTMAHETPETIMVRRYLTKQKQLDLLLPEANRQPTISQFNPELFYFEEQDHNLFCTAYSGIPLVRYDLKDYGGVLKRCEVHEKLASTRYDFEAAAKEAGISDALWNLPYIYVYERSDFSVSYYAFTVYPDFIRRPLQHDSLSRKITGKFVMHVDYSSEGRQRLNVNVELKAEVEPTEKLVNDIQHQIHAGLYKESSEYRETFNMVGAAVKPTVYLQQYEHSEYFRPGTKQKWVER